MSFARIVGKMASAAAPVANAYMLQKMQDQAMQARLDTLNQYQKDAVEAEHTYQDTVRKDQQMIDEADKMNARVERAQDRATDLNRFNTTTGLAREQLEITKQGQANEQDRWQRETENSEQVQNYQKELIQSQIEESGINIKNLKRSDQIIDSLMNITDPAEYDRAMKTLILSQGKEPSKDYKFFKVKDDMEAETIVRTNERTGEITDASTTGAKIPPQAAIQFLLSSPTKLNKQFFDQKYGAGMADKILSGK